MKTASSPQLALVALALLAGCRDESVLTDGGPLVHVDPRLEDGRSPAAVLETLSEVRQSFAWQSPEQLVQPWSAHQTEYEDKHEAPGLHMLGLERKIEGGEKISLIYAAPLEASQVNMIELDLGYITAGTTRLYWSTTKSGDYQASIEVAHEATHEQPLTVRLSLANHPLWRGTIDRVRIVPNATTAQNFQLFEIRFVNEGFAVGDSPLSASDGADPVGTVSPLAPLDRFGDGGLITIDGEARRSWPTSLGVPLYVRDLKLPPGARFECEVAGVATSAGQGTHFAVDIRQGQADWEEVVAKKFDPSHWSPLDADLRAWAGKPVDLRLRAWRQRSQRDATGVELTAGDVYWGAPKILSAPHGRRRPNVVLITLDTTRYDALGAYAPQSRGKAPPAATPFLDQLARTGILFEDSWSASNATTPSHTTLMTGLAVQDHGVVNNRSALGPESETLAELFRKAGYQTAGAVSVAHLRSDRSGLGQGFDTFRQSDVEAPRDGAITVDAVLEWLDGWQSRGDRPLFLWVHLFDPHTPYAPPENFYRDYLAHQKLAEPARLAAPGGETIGESYHTDPGAFLEGVTNPEYGRFLYGAGVSYADQLVAELHAGLAQHGFLDQAVLCVTSDHGESLGQHDIWFDHAGLYEESLRVPQILVLPQGPSGLRVPDLVSGVDLARTLLAAADIAAPASMRGRNLLELVESPRREPVAQRIWFEHSSRLSIGSRDSSIHFIAEMELDLSTRQVGETPEAVLVFEHRKDPELLDDLALERPELAGEGISQLFEWRAQSLARQGLELSLTGAQQAELEALGYFGGAELPGVEPGPSSAPAAQGAPGSQDSSDAAGQRRDQ